MQPTTTYYAVIFTSKRSIIDMAYDKMAEQMEVLAKKQPGFISVEAARDELGITVSYWESLEAIKNWKENTAHLFAQEKGKSDWYMWYKVRICKIEREYEFNID